MNIDVLLKEAVTQHSQGNLEKARDIYNKILQQRPEYTRVYVLLGSVEYSLGNLQEAEKLFRKALEIDPEYAVAYYNLGFIMEERGDIEAAIEHYTKATQLNPENADAFHRLGTLLKQRGDVEGAIKAFKRAIELGEKEGVVEEEIEEILSKVQDQVREKEKIREAENLLAEGFFLEENGRLEQAIEKYREALQIAPNHLVGIFLLGMALEKAGRAKEAWQFYRRIAEGDISRYLKNVSRAAIDLLNRRLKSEFSQATLEGFVRKIRDLARVKENFSLLSYVESFFQGAEKHISKGLMNENSGNLEEALREYAKAIEAEPLNPAPYYIMGLALEKAGRSKEAENYYKKALELDMDLLAPIQDRLREYITSQIGSMYLSQIDLSRVLREFREHISSGGRASFGDFLRNTLTSEAAGKIREGYLLDVSGSTEAAIEHYKEAVKIDPNNLVAHYILGLAYEAIGDARKALESYKKTEQIDLEKAPRSIPKDIIDILNKYMERKTKDGRRVGTLLKRYIEIVGENPDKSLKLLKYIEEIKLDSVAKILEDYMRKGKIGRWVIEDREDFPEETQEETLEEEGENITAIWSYKTGRSIRSVSISLDADVIAGSSEIGKVYVLSRSGSKIFSHHFKEGVNNIALSPEGEVLGISLKNGEVVLLNTSSGEELRRISLKQAPVGIALSSGAEYIVVSTRDLKILLLTQEGVRKWEVVASGYCSRLGITPDASRVVACTDTGEFLKILNRGAFPVTERKIFNEPLFSVDISENGYVALGSKRGNVYLIDPEGGVVWKRNFRDFVYGVGISQMGELIAAGLGRGVVNLLDKKGEVVGSYNAQVNLWDVDIDARGEHILAGLGLIFGNLLFLRPE